MILDYLHKSRTCHTLKDLEKVLPSVASVNGMQVKDYVQALHDDNMIHVEKIGSGNWYWSWAGEEKTQLEKTKAGLEADIAKIEANVKDMEAKREVLVTESGGVATPEEERERQNLFERKSTLEPEVLGLRAEEAGRINGAMGGTDDKEKNIDLWTRETQMWTENIYMLEDYLRGLARGDRETVDAVLRVCYGEEYVDGEGLRELHFPD